MIGYWVGLAGVVFEAVKDDVLAMIAFVVLGTGLDVGKTTVSLVKMLREEGSAFERKLNEDLESGEGDSSRD